MKPLRMVIVGLGQWGQNWVGSLTADADYKVVALVDSVAGRAETVCAKHGLDPVCAFEEIDEALRRTDPEAAVITVPPSGHFAVAMKCMANGLHILSEKPLADRADEAYALLTEAEKRGTRFMVSQDYRWQPAVQTLRRLIANGAIGEVGYITYRHFQSHRLGGWREQMEHVVLEDMSTHHFDLLRYLTGRECLRVYSDSFNPKWSWYRGGAVASVQFVFEGDMRAQYLGTWVTLGWIDESTTGEIRIDGSRGSLMLTPKSEIYLYADGASKAIVHEPMDRTGRDFALRAFARAVRHGAPLETDIRDNIKSFIMTCAAIRSVAENRPVDLGEMRAKGS